MSHCPYCSLSLNHSGGDVFCSRNASDFEQLESGIFVIQGQDIHSGSHLSRFAMRFVQKGKMSFRIDGQRHNMDSGGVVLFREHSSYTFDTASESLHTGIAFKPSFVRSAAAAFSLDHNRLLDKHHASSSLIFSAYTRWPHSRRSDALGQKLWQKANSRVHDRNLLDELAYEAMNWYLGETAFYRQIEPKFFQTKRQSTRLELVRRLKTARELVEYHPPAALSVQKLAVDSGLSEFHFIRLYRQAFGLTPHRHIVEKRLGLAHFLLHSTAMPIGEISAVCGYEDHSAFSRAYRQFFAKTPAETRSEHIPELRNFCTMHRAKQGYI